MPRHVHAKPLLRPLELTDHLRGLFYLVRSHPPGGLAEEALKILNQQQWSACLMIRAALRPTATHRSPAPSSSQESQGNRTLEDRVWLYFFFGGDTPTTEKVVRLPARAGVAAARGLCWKRWWCIIERRRSTKAAAFLSSMQHASTSSVMWSLYVVCSCFPSRAQIKESGYIYLSYSLLLVKTCWCRIY